MNWNDVRYTPNYKLYNKWYLQILIAFVCQLLKQYGNTSPLVSKMTLAHEALVGSSCLLAMATSCNKMPWQGTVSLQSKFIATFDALVPFIFLYSTLLTFTADAYSHHYRYTMYICIPISSIKDKTEINLITYQI